MPSATTLEFIRLDQLKIWNMGRPSNDCFHWCHLRYIRLLLGVFVPSNNVNFDHYIERSDASKLNQSRKSDPGIRAKLHNGRLRACIRARPNFRAN